MISKPVLIRCEGCGNLNLTREIKKFFNRTIVTRICHTCGWSKKKEIIHQDNKNIFGVYRDFV